MSLVALSELLGAPVRDATGTVRGRVREIAIAPQDHPTRVAYLIVKTSDGERMLPSAAALAVHCPRGRGAISTGVAAGCRARGRAGRT